MKGTTPVCISRSPRRLIRFSGSTFSYWLATQYLLNRGERFTEILKQPQFSPKTIELQVVLLYSATRGYLDNMPVDKIAQYEKAVIQQVEPQLLEQIREKGQITPELDKQIGDFLKGVTNQIAD